MFKKKPVEKIKPIKELSLLEKKREDLIKQIDQINSEIQKEWDNRSIKLGTLMNYLYEYTSKEVEKMEHADLGYGIVRENTFNEIIKLIKGL